MLTRKIKKIFLFCLLFIAVMLISTSYWIVDKFGEVTLEQVLFHIYMPLDADQKMIVSFIRNTIFWAIGVVALVGFLICDKFYFKGIRTIKKLFQRHLTAFVFAVVIISLIVAYVQLNVHGVIKSYMYPEKLSRFYEIYYTNPRQVQLTFPSKKQNLILIFLESIETSFADSFDVNLIPNIENLAKENLSFSDRNALGGASSMEGTGWTSAGLVSQICGIPLRMPINSNHYRMYSSFLPGAVCLPDILKENGYTIDFLIGSEGQFAGLNAFFNTHGNIRLKDFHYFKETKKIPSNYRVYWGMEDAKLYEFAKEELQLLSQQKAPFFFGMMTIDSHFADGYLDEKTCHQPYNETYKNVISCADSKIGLFIDWLQEQPFYKDTTVVLVGDHLCMNKHIFNDKMHRKMINIFMNPYKKPQETTNRQFTPFDIYPTILEAMGIQIEGSRLALGTSLFSGRPTLLEEIKDIRYFNEEIMRRSAVYDQIFYGDLLLD